MNPVENWLAEVERKEVDGVLLFKEAPFGYLLLTSGKYKGRIVIKTHPLAEVDGDKVTWFAKQLTWVSVSEIEDCDCRRVGWPHWDLDYVDADWNKVLPCRPGGGRDGSGMLMS
jgi:hypothetical protein